MNSERGEFVLPDRKGLVVRLPRNAEWFHEEALKRFPLLAEEISIGEEPAIHVVMGALASYARLRIEEGALERAVAVIEFINEILETDPSTRDLEIDNAVQISFLQLNEILSSPYGTDLTRAMSGAVLGLLRDAREDNV